MSNATAGRILFYGALVVFLAIQAAIVVPGFLEAQIRSRVARVAHEMRIVSAAIEAYRVDHGSYPPPEKSSDGWTRLPTVLTTPKAYLETMPLDHFDRQRGTLGYALVSENPERWAGLTEGHEDQPTVVLISLGPTKERGPFRLDWSMVYEPTNGTVSAGYLYRFSNPDSVSQETEHWSLRMAREKRETEVEPALE